MSSRAAIFALTCVGLAALAGTGAWALAGLAEAVTSARATAALERTGADWARLEADGLSLRVSGAAPDADAARAALTAAAGAAPLARVADAVERPPPPPAEPTAPIAAPSSSPPSAATPPVVEEGPVALTRGANGLTVAGPATPALVEALADALARLPDAPALTDVTLPRAGEPDPRRLGLAVAGARALAAASEGRAEVTRGMLRLTASVPDADQRAAIERDLRAEAPGGALLLIDLTSPPPVLSPFRLVAALGESGPTLLACDVQSKSDRDDILGALDDLGPPPGGGAVCRVGLGAPSGWPEAAVAGIEALGRLGIGRFELSDTEAALIAFGPGIAVRLEEAGRALGAALPEGYALRVVGPRPGHALPRGAADGAPEWFAAVRAAAEGPVRLSGGAPDAPSRNAVAAYARARFGADLVEDALSVTGAPPPPAWRRAALAAVDALVPLADGAARFDGEALLVRGRALRPRAAPEVHAALAPLAESGTAASSAVTVDLPALAAELPLPPAECLSRLQAEVAAAPIAFDPGEAAISAESEATLDRLGRLMRRCEGLVVEIGGHTDSQGRESTNEALSQSRASAVLDALFARGASLDKMTARGYGESRPVAPNDTEEGRARNRRIEFADLREALAREAAEEETE